MDYHFLTSRNSESSGSTLIKQEGAISRRQIAFHRSLNRTSREA